MLRLDPRWGQSPESLFHQSLHAATPRLRERFLALALVASGQSASQVASRLHRRRQTVAEWIHHFNQHGSEGIVPQFKSPACPRLTPQELEQLKKVLQQPPRAVGLAGGRWSSRKGAAYIAQTFHKTVSAETARRYLRRLGFRLKLPRKEFLKADPEAQRRFAQEVESLEQRRWAHSVTAWVDEGHIYQDALLRRLWCLKGQPAVVPSCSPPRGRKVSFYVAVVRPLGRVITMPVERFNGPTTAEFVTQIRTQLPGYRIDVIWDNATHHKGPSVQQALHRAHLHPHFLPAYSPKMNAAEAWIRWSKEELSYNTCWDTLPLLRQAFEDFGAGMKQRTADVLSRCVPELFGFKCV